MTDDEKEVQKLFADLFASVTPRTIVALSAFAKAWEAFPAKVRGAVAANMTMALRAPMFTFDEAARVQCAVGMDERSRLSYAISEGLLDAALLFAALGQAADEESGIGADLPEHPDAKEIRARVGGGSK